MPHIVQHRFRRAENGYPLIQVGAGILAVNATRGYSWRTYLPNILDAVAQLRDTYTGELATEAVSLRYLNAQPFDFATGDVFEYMRQSFKVSVAYPPQLFT